MTYLNEIKFSDTLTDAFGRLIVATPTGLHDAQFTYDLQPLLYEQVTNGTGATISYDSTNRMATMSFSSTAIGGKAFMQSYDWFRYQPGKSQEPTITFNFKSQTANCLKFAEYGDGVNGFAFQNNGTTNQFVIYSSTSGGTVTIPQVEWTIDKLNGAGASGITLDITKQQILIIDLQALYSGSVRFGFFIGGKKIWCHKVDNANVTIYPYIANANLPIRVGMTCTGTVTTTMDFHCSSVVSGGGQEIPFGYEFAVPMSSDVTVGSTLTHCLSVRPKTTFNGITNRSRLTVIELDTINTGNNPIEWQLVLGQAITGTTTFSNINTTYSSYEYNTAGTISGSPAMVIDSGYVVASNQVKDTANMELTNKYPISLDAAGAVRALGTISIIAKTTSGASSTARMSLKIREVR